jgi:hypothetical protein
MDFRLPPENPLTLVMGSVKFEQAWKASGLSSNMDDYFQEDVAKLVAVK